MRDELDSALAEAVAHLLREAGDAGEVPEIALDAPRQAEHGDFACSVALQLAKRLKKPPREIAEALVREVGDAGGAIERAEVAGPGFVNFWLRRDRWRALLAEILRAGERFGGSELGKGESVQVEFVSANPTGPLSTGHGRQGVLGDSIARLLAFTGHDVTREYYFNNGGRQMRVLGQSVKGRYLEQLGLAAPPPAEPHTDERPWPLEIEGLPVAFPHDGYQGDYVREIAASLREEKGAALVDEPPEGLFRARAEEVIFAEIRATLDRMGIVFDVYFNEKTLYDEGRLDQIVTDLEEKDLVYKGEGALWLAATKWGLNRDRVVIRSNGEPTYLLPDLAYHRQKFERGFARVIDVMGADHIEQFPFVRGAMAALGFDPDRVELVMHQFVTLSRGGQKVKQSTRRATYVTVDELIDDVGADVFRFFMIERKAEGHLDFDLDLAKDKNWRKNPAYGVQYAHARTHGIERTAAEAGVAMPIAEGFDAGRLELPAEIDLVKKLSEFPELVERSAQTREPHHVAYYLRELSGLFNSYIQDGKNHRVVSDDEGLTAARLALVLGIRTVIANGLALLGVSAPEHM